LVQARILSLTKRPAILAKVFLVQLGRHDGRKVLWYEALELRLTVHRAEICGYYTLARADWG
jgi:hypothetical protein